MTTQQTIDNNQQKSVLIVSGNENPVLPIMKNLHDHEIPITVASPGRFSIEFASRYPRSRLVCPDPRESEEDFQDWLLSTLKGGKYAVTMACGEEQTWQLAQCKDRIREYTALTVPDLPLFMTCRDKSQTMKAAARLGIPIPATYYPEEDGIEAVAKQVPRYPIVLKPCISNGARGISYPGSPDALKKAYEQTRQEFGPCIVQEFISHKGMQYKAEIILDKEKNILASGVYNKPRFYPPEGGSSTLNSTVDRPDIIRTAIDFLSGISWSGMGDCDFIVDPVDNVPKLMEVNPRFTRSIKVLIVAGIEYPYLLYRLARGLPCEPQHDYKKEVYLRYFISDCVWFLRSKDRFRAKPSWFKFFGRNMHEEIFAWSDPLPSAVFTLSMLLRLFSRKERRFLLRNKKSVKQ